MGPACLTAAPHAGGTWTVVAQRIPLAASPGTRAAVRLFLSSQAAPERTAAVQPGAGQRSVHGATAQGLELQLLMCHVRQPTSTGVVATSAGISKLTVMSAVSSKLYESCAALQCSERLPAQPYSLCFVPALRLLGSGQSHSTRTLQPHVPTTWSWPVSTSDRHHGAGA